ncbi:hypothetical protein [Pseudonocardia humida]|uniref:Ribbon-helix-helix CopG family protein n=1 Tax=Pseudonocardia humida TaxID=2800819 RepID=A0ABT1AB73_9PSEU|nr:hypothetical protein [Pseudonocardia humida]MCO1660285.1 hypothetical protein [Pseudonocardia humida]
MDSSAAHRLAELLETAAPDDRRAITAWLLERPPAPVPAGPDLDLMMRYGNAPIGALHRIGTAWMGGERVERLRGALAPGEESQLVTLRLPQERHAQLRQWCTEHDFSMAAVIRGLVEQFLEARGASGSAAPGPADS